MPKISVILPIYNAQSFIADAVKSVLTQSEKDFELILIDDASSDDTPRILARMTDPRVNIVRHEENLGLVASLNEGLHLSRGRFIARMDHDDIAMPDRFAQQLAFLEVNHSVGVVGTGYQLINGEGKLGPRYRPPVTHEEISWAMSFVCPLAHPTVVARRELLIACGGYSDAAAYAEDYDLWERLSRKVKFANLPDPLLLLRKHKENMTEVWLDRNIAVATGVASRRIAFLLGEEVERDVVRCLYTQGYLHQERIEHSIELIMRLMHVCKTKYPSVHRIIQHDAAIRIALMGLRAKRPSLALTCLFQASKLNPNLASELVKKLMRRIFNKGVVQLVG
ncbi:glycosyltransferase [Rhodobacterales bacterium LSUCC0031]|nr:glycosyltransferase [Rhodobacterales bacterium LSUCC0031]